MNAVQWQPMRCFIFGDVQELIVDAEIVGSTRNRGDGRFHFVGWYANRFICQSAKCEKRMMRLVEGKIARLRV